jgi:hypothetical protein
VFAADLCQVAEWLTRWALQISWKIIQNGKRWAFAMGQPIAVRTDYTVAKVLRWRSRRKTPHRRAGCWRAPPLDGSSRTEAATNAGMDRQTLRHGVIRFSEQGPDGLVWSTFLRQVLPQAQ